MTNTTADLGSHQASADASAHSTSTEISDQNTGFSQQESIRNIEHSSVNDTNQDQASDLNTAAESLQNKQYMNQPYENIQQDHEFLNQPNENIQQDNEYLSQSNSSSGQNQPDHLNQSATSGDDSLDQSEGSLGRFYNNDYVGEEEHIPTRQSSVQGIPSSEQQGSQTFDITKIETTNVNADTGLESGNIPSQIIGSEPVEVPNETEIETHTVPFNDLASNTVPFDEQASHSVPFNDQMSQNYVSQEYNVPPNQGYQYYPVDQSQGQTQEVAKENDRDEDINQPPKSETHSAKSETHSDSDGWEVVNPNSIGPVPGPTHSRNQSMDNNVQFFISSGNSSLRVSPSGSSKSKDELEGHNEEHVDGAKGESEYLRDRIENMNLYDKSHIETHIQPVHSNVVHAPPPLTSSGTGYSAPSTSSSLGPPPMGGAGGSNPFRKSPLTLNVSTSKSADTSPHFTQDSVLSSTRLDATKTNFENSPVSLNQSISPIPPSVEAQNMNINNMATDSPDIQGFTKPGISPDTPLSSTSQRIGVPQSPIMPRKESPFQPPVPVPRIIPDSRNKPVKASHDIPGIALPQNANLYGRNKPDYEKDTTEIKPVDNEINQRDKKLGRTTPDLDKSVEKLTSETRSGRKTPEWDSNRRGYERKTGRRTPDWDGERTTDRNRGRRTPDWDSRQGGDRYGRRTPDWDSRRTGERSQGRRTPDWDSRQSSSRYGRRTPDWDQAGDNDNSRRSYDRADDSIRDRRDFDEDKLSSKPPAGSSGISNKSQPRPAAPRSAFRDMVKSRSKNNVSPATSLLNFEPPVVANVLLAPAATDTKIVKKDTSEELADLKPVASLISSLSEQINTDDSVPKVKSQPKSKSDEKPERLKPDKSREPNVRTGYEKEPNVRTGYDRNSERSNREVLRQNRSYEKGLNDSRNVSREKLKSYGSRDSLESELRDDSREERYRRGNSRDRERLDPYDRYYRYDIL